jgi:branched-chain amino acid transport system substrate-binding protein
MKTWKNFPGLEGAVYYYYGFPKNKVNDWLVAEHKKRHGGEPPDFFTAGGMAAAIAAVEAIKKAGGTDTEKLIAAMEDMSFESPKGKMTFRKQDHQALQSMYQFRIKKKQADEWDLLELVREIPASEIPLPIKNKR